MAKKIGISLTKEMDTVLSSLAAEKTISKSRLIETYLREHPQIRKKLSEQRQIEIVLCKQCGTEIGPEQVKIATPNNGTLCVDCWSKLVGEFVEKHPISDRQLNGQP